MRPFTPSSIALAAVALTLAASHGAYGADAGAVPSRNVTLVAVPVVGAEAVRITGSAPTSPAVEAILYARFSRDLPTVLLSRRSVPTDPSGHFDSTLPIAPAFFRNAIVTVVVRNLSSGATATASITVTAPNVPAPPDALPPSVQ
ncbi:MAG TPA: hypothetical protein VGN14_02420 [Candidatus Elarobacter sp.]|jgi:hypothetical protein